jgi:hypothetical protein
MPPSLAPLAWLQLNEAPQVLLADLARGLRGFRNRTYAAVQGHQQPCDLVTTEFHLHV